jgi:hypothetical protein
MPLATKNNALIIKDGKVAENCKCCDLCVNPPPYLKMTVSGLPDKINSPYRARSIADDNGSEYTMFQITKSRYKLLPTRCAWAGGGHSAYNRVNQLDGFSADWWYLDADNDFIFAYNIRFAPPDGATFRSLPYTDPRPLVPVSFGGEDWSNVVITLDEGKASYLQCGCPGGFSDYSNCTSSDVAGGIAITACNTTSPGHCLASVDDYAVRVSFSFVGDAYRQYGQSPRAYDNDFQANLSAIDSDLDLIWKNDSAFIGYDAIRVYTGIKDTNLISQGYRFLGKLSGSASYGSSNTFTQRFWIAAAIRPTASIWEADSYLNPITTRCAQGQVSWNAQVMLFPDTGDSSPFSLRAPPGTAGAYFTIPCNTYTCGQGPQSFSITKTVPFNLNPFPFASDSGSYAVYFTGTITLESA